MIFDKICGAFEYLKPIEDDKWRFIRRGLSSCALFHMPDGIDPFVSAGIVGRKLSESDGEAERICDRMNPPFDTVAIEHDRYRCLFLCFEGKNPKASGLSAYDRVVVVNGVHKPTTDAGDPDFTKLEAIGLSLSHTIFFEVYYASLSLQGDLIGISLRSSIDMYAFDTRSKLWAERTIDAATPEAGDLAEEAVYGIRLLCCSMHPRRYIVRRVPEKARPIPKGRLPRSDQRPRYVVVDNKEITRLLREPSGDPDSKLRTGHRRRACFHRLEAERYRFKRGQMIPVKSCWVGPKEGRDGGERYEILVDLAACE